MLETLRIAIVDDEVSVLTALARLLQSVGLQAETFGSVGQFLTAFQKAPPDCVVLDQHMPVISGLALLKLLPPGFPAVLVSGLDAPDDPLLTSGGVVFLRKPLDELTLLGAIRQVCRKNGATGTNFSQDHP